MGQEQSVPIEGRLPCPTLSHLHLPAHVTATPCLLPGPRCRANLQPEVYVEADEQAVSEAGEGGGQREEEGQGRDRQGESRGRQDPRREQ